MNSPNQQREPQKGKSGFMAALIRDLVPVLTIGLLLTFIHFFATPFRRGFHCDDDTIRYPYKESTISSNLLYISGSSLNILLILVFEYLCQIKEAGLAAQTRESHNQFNVRLYIRRVYCRILVWFFGAITSELLTDISKFTAGRLRPHFIAVCNPIIEEQWGINEYCSKDDNRYRYITNYRCSTMTEPRDARLSFMSGHSSYAAYSATFAVFYVQSAVDVFKYGLIKPACQVLIISAAFYTGLTRVSDYKHHWQDVLTGLLQGASVAMIVSLILWPSVFRLYEKYLKPTSNNRVTGDEQVGEELNTVSY